MRRPHLDDLPPLDLPSGYTLRTLQPEDESALAHLLAHAFGEMEWEVKHVQERLTRTPDVKMTFVITHDENLVATASVRLLPEEYPGSGYVHWVGGHSDHKGKRLGYLVSAATMHEFKRLGCHDAVLETDDQRLPAIKTYLNLGFVPENRHETHPERWKSVLAQLK